MALWSIILFLKLFLKVQILGFFIDISSLFLDLARFLTQSGRLSRDCQMQLNTVLDLKFRQNQLATQVTRMNLLWCSNGVTSDHFGLLYHVFYCFIQMSSAFDGHSSLTFAKRSLERSFQNFCTGIVDSIPGITMHGVPRLHWDFSRVVTKVDKTAFREFHTFQVRFFELFFRSFMG